ncbi:hypothetical protein [[Erwinia] mediterraneensis]|uniref:hypothetical protein n=1 Tax=[Erwinia] mediterraneensis TaxID=2161819 RepID=UPI001F225D87|nr:hypothetical protein [[Erwinia] mediterraneensis]
MKILKPFLYDKKLSEFSHGVYLKKTGYNLTDTAMSITMPAGKMKLERSAYPLLSEKQFVEIARRILTGKYITTTGFMDDLVGFLLTAGDTDKINANRYSRDIYFLAEHHLIESIITWQSWPGISGLRQEKLH